MSTTRRPSWRHSEDISGASVNRFGDWSFVLVDRRVTDVYHHCRGTKGLVSKYLGCMLCHTEVPDEINMMLKLHETRLT